MKKLMIAVAVICLFCSYAYAADDCDTRYREIINALKSTNKIQDNQKNKYLPSIEKAYQLCQQGKMEEAGKIMDDVKDQFFNDALTNQREFFGN